MKLKPFSWSHGPALIVLATLLWPASRHYFSQNQIYHSFYLILLSSLLAYLLIPVSMVIATITGLLDHPNESRKHHKKPVPLTGGIAIFGAFLITMLINFHFSIEMKGILIAGSLVFIVGLIDDKWALSAKIRLLAQFIAVAILIYSGVRISFIPNWLGGSVAEVIITALWVVGITNSMNFIDGMDGLASGTSIIYAIFFAVIALILKQYYMLFLAAAIAGSCIGFFPYNFRLKGTAKIYLGDSGSTFLGFTFASFALLGNWGPSFLDLTIPIIIMSVLIFDMSLTTIVRVFTGQVKTFGQWLHFTGRDHFHHRINLLGIGPKASALVFFSVSICFGLLAIAVLFSDFINTLLILGHTVLMFIIMGIILVLRTRNHPPINKPIEHNAALTSNQNIIVNNPV